jgi:hypothetical protein
MAQLPRPGLENNQGINVKNRNRAPLPNCNNNIPVRITHRPELTKAVYRSNLINIQPIRNTVIYNKYTTYQLSYQQMLGELQRKLTRFNKLLNLIMSMQYV